jgi:DNA polymerase III delta prime subunit
MNARELKKAVEQQQLEHRAAHHILLYGLPKTGKTLVAASVAKLDFIRKVYYFDLDNGFASVINAELTPGVPYLTDAELDKIEVMPIVDSPAGDVDTFEKMNIVNEEVPKAALILSKVLRERKTHYYSYDLQGLAVKPTANTIDFNFHQLTNKDCIVIDSGTQLSNSLYTLAQVANPDYRDPRKWWGAFTQNANALLSKLQSSKAHIVMVCHANVIEADPIKMTKAETIPIFGSAPYSRNVGRYFDSVIYLHVSAGKYKSISLASSKGRVMAGTRFNIDISTLDNLTFADIIGYSERSKVLRHYLAQQRQAKVSDSTKNTGTVKSKPGNNVPKRATIKVRT